MDRVSPLAPVPASQAAALRRAQELTAELTEVVVAVRAHLAELEFDAVAADESALPQEEMRTAFTAARRTADAERRRRWTDVLLTES